MKKIVFALIAAATAMSAAQAQQVPRGYVGGSVVTADRYDTVPGAASASEGKYKAGAKLFGGYELNQTWGVEAGYTDFGSKNQEYTLNGANGRAQTEGSSTYLAAKATAPLNERVAIYGKAGVAHNKRELTATNAVLNRDVSKTEAYGAVGVQYKLNEQVALTAEYERYGKKREFGVKPDAWTVGARYSF